VLKISFAMYYQLSIGYIMFVDLWNDYNLYILFLANSDDEDNIHIEGIKSSILFNCLTE